MNQQGNTTNLDVNLLIKEYEATITTLISENVKYKTLLKQKLSKSAASGRNDATCDLRHLRFRQKK